ncbi:MAG TPA: hypothetical protein VGO86_06970 [Candidatus Dormibacteraeota bacterium]
MREELVDHFERDIGRPPAGARERILSGLRGAPSQRQPRRHLQWAAWSAAVLLAVLVVGTLVEARQGPGRQPAAGHGEVPVPRSGAAVAYDPRRGLLVMFGGTTDGVTPLDDTWTWDGTHWSRQHPAASPPQRTVTTEVTPGRGSKPVAVRPLLMAYDGVSGTLVLYGVPGGTWTWDGQTWQPHAGSTAPDGAVAMAYDPASRAVLLYLASTGGTSQTWRWDGASWTQLRPRTAPDVVRGAMAFDGRRLLLFGTPSGLVQGQHLTETWAWDGGDWSPLSPAVRLPSSEPYPAAYDQADDRLVTLIDPGAAPSAETWRWDGASWSREHPRHSPPARSGAAVWYDSRTRRVVLYGGFQPGGVALGDMWAWDGRDWNLLEETKR